ncbi:MAG: glycosyltransferase family 4 protein [Acidobacteria bacterium]|nr:glycosyltransferase family 4 protein [Acidobacteriota bacterium]
MRVLIVSHYYPPEPDPRLNVLGPALAKRGHEVTALTGFPNYPRGEIYPGYRQRLWRCEELGGVRVVRLPLYPDHGYSALRRALNFLSFTASATLLGPALSGPADIMLVAHAPVTAAVPAAVIGWMRRVPFVYEVQDMWPETLRSTGVANNSILVGALARAGDFAYRRAAAITVISPGFKRNLIGKGVPAEKIQVIPTRAIWDRRRAFPTYWRRLACFRTFRMSSSFWSATASTGRCWRRRFDTGGSGTCGCFRAGR